VRTSPASPEGEALTCCAFSSKRSANVDFGVSLRAENKALRKQLAEALTELAQVSTELQRVLAELVAAQRRIAELEQRGDEPPPLVRPNRPRSTDPKPPRRKRAPQYNRARQREAPTQIVRHSLERCPECKYRLRGESLDYARQVIELPPPQPVEVIEHQVIKRYCPHCGRWRSPKLDLTGQVLGQSRMGVRLTGLIAYLRTSLRLPVRAIQSYLETAHELSISTGEIVLLLDQVRQATTEAVAGLKREMRASMILHADETGWRQDGQNGYIWAFSTPGEQGIRYYEFDQSRGQAVMRRILGGEFHGHLVSDFYCGYNDYEGQHQRCWTHLLRDLHELKEKQAKDPSVVEWAKAVRELYDETQKWLQKARDPSRQQREEQYVSLVGKTHALGLQYAQVEHPCRALAKRLLRHEDELFQFVLIDGLSANNNLAERSIRPMVIMRKISGGSRSPSGTKTRMALASLFATWQARGLNPFVQCLELLSRQPTPAS